MPEQIEGLEHAARAFFGSDRNETYAVGVIVGICNAPTYKIRRPDGTEFTWRVDLTEVGQRVPPNDNRYPARASSQAHYIVYEHEVPGVPTATEAVCYCGAHFISRAVVTGTIGELFAAHIRSIRTREQLDEEERRRRIEREL